MELDDFKLAWQTLDQRLQQQNAVGLQLLRERGLDNARKHLRPLWWGQVAQMLLGLLCVLLGATCWNQLSDQPPILVAGIVMHAYGAATLIAGGRRAHPEAAGQAAAVLRRQWRRRRFGLVGVVDTVRDDIGRAGPQRRGAGVDAAMGVHQPRGRRRGPVGDVVVPSLVAPSRSPATGQGHG